jgi:hypothetical protein
LRIRLGHFAPPAIAHLEDALDRVHVHLLATDDADELMRLSRALSPAPRRCSTPTASRPCSPAAPA